MTEVWRQSQLQWLAIQHEVCRRQLDSSLAFEEFPDPAPSQIALIQIFSDLLDETITPTTAATRISDWVLSVPDTDICYDIDRAYNNMTGVLFQSAACLSAPRHLQLLANLVVALSHLPDAHNTTSKTLHFEGSLATTPPGERIKLAHHTGGGLWSDLPDFASTTSSYIRNGPALWLQDVEPSLSGPDHAARHQHLSRQAEDRFTNFNTFAALIAQQAPTHGSPLCCCIHWAFAAIAALEFPPESQFGRHSHLSVRAAAMWLVMHGEAIVERGQPGSAHYNYLEGSLWTAAGGTEVVDGRRLRFWKERLSELGASGRLVSREALGAVEHGVVALDGLIALRG